jgi:transcriptional regulator with XRE-family HTH domain
MLDVRKAFGQRVKQLRKKQKWTQKELANKFDVQLSMLNKYESGLHIPPAEKLVRLAEIFDTTVDYLLTGDRTEARPLHNIRLLERFQAIEEFKADDQEALMRLIDAMIIKNKVEGVIKPFEQQAG